MRILLLVHSFNSLSQRLHVELRESGHDVALEFDVNDRVTAEAVELHRPDVLVAPFLKRAIPENVWRRLPCLIVHPGPPGDRGPASLDWAVLEDAPEWGVTVLQATAEMDGGPVWAAAAFPMRAAAKGSLYRREVTQAAVSCVLQALEGIAAGKPAPPPVAGRERPAVRPADRRIDWKTDDAATVLRKIRSADGMPGLRDQIAGREILLFDAHPAPGLTGAPGELLARCGGAVARVAGDGNAVWIGHMKRRLPAGDQPGELKLSAVSVLGEIALGLPQVADGPPDISYSEENGVGFLEFPFYNGAMGVSECRRLLAAYRQAQARDTRVLVLSGGPDFWSNGIHLNQIEAADSPADESLRAINAINDLAEAVINTTDRLTVAALSGNAGAGGVFLALGADFVWPRAGAVLNPHYKGMGNLYGSEYWTYVLPRRIGPERAEVVTQARLPMGAAEAVRLGLADAAFGADVDAHRAEVRARAAALAADPALPLLLRDKQARRAADEAAKPLAAYRAEELARMHLNFYGFDPSYHVARYHFVYKIPKSRTPYYLATHRG
jgi:putative two-component system protein, hydrogenase maturation factor HypX/HoxX